MMEQPWIIAKGPVSKLAEVREYFTRYGFEIVYCDTGSPERTDIERGFWMKVKPRVGGRDIRDDITPPLFLVQGLNNS